MSALRDQAHWKWARLHLCTPATSTSRHSQTHGRTLKESVFRAWTAVPIGHSLWSGAWHLSALFGSCCLLTLHWWPWRPAMFGAICRQEEMASLVLGACLCFNIVCLLRGWPSYPSFLMPPSNTRENKWAIHARRERAMKGGGVPPANSIESHWLFIYIHTF